jgi:hypothetical protein
VALRGLSSCSCPSGRWTGCLVETATRRVRASSDDKEGGLGGARVEGSGIGLHAVDGAVVHGLLGKLLVSASR